jgi:hypothetical protein
LCGCFVAVVLLFLLLLLLLLLLVVVVLVLVVAVVIYYSNANKLLSEATIKFRTCNLYFTLQLACKGLRQQ